MKYRIKTLGCKVNQVDSMTLAETLEGLGCSKASRGEPARICIINTCTVTARTDTQCRQMIRKTIRENPGARVVVTGCYSETAAHEVRSIDGVHRILGNLEKREAREILSGEIDHLRTHSQNHKGPDPAEQDGISGKEVALPRQTREIHGRSRAFVQVQDGCHAFCAYCIVPYARGPLRSEDPDKVVQQVRTRVEQGFPEIVLSGIHLGAYGLERNEHRGLTRLVQRLIRLPGDFRLRLSSLEPGEVDDELIRMVTSEDKVCNHLHIPLQSADNEILSRMKRPYTLEQFSELVWRLRERDPKMGIGTDLIAGLPGESDDSFEKSYDRISRLPLTHFHIFPYSMRSGTAAASMEGQVAPTVKKERAARLRELSDRMKRRFLRQITGETFKAVSISKENSRERKVLLSNYLEGCFMDNSSPRPGIFSVKVFNRIDDKLFVQ